MTLRHKGPIICLKAPQGDTNEELKNDPLMKPKVSVSHNHNGDSEHAVANKEARERAP